MGCCLKAWGLVRPQALVDFVAELTPSNDEDVKGGSGGWILYVDGASNVQGSGAVIILEGPDGVLVKKSLKFAFQASNNQAKYEALLAGMRLVIDIGVNRLVVRSDSQLGDRTSGRKLLGTRPAFGQLPGKGIEYGNQF